MKKTYELLESLEKKIIFLVLEKPELKGLTFNFIGSGFIINQQYLVSNFHIYQAIKEKSDFKLYMGLFDKKDTNTGVTSYKKTFLDIDNLITEINSDNDLVAIELPERVLTENSFSITDLVSEGLSDDFKLGDDAIYCGFPLATDFIQMGIGLTFFVSKCIVSSLKYNAEKKNIHYLLIDSHVNPSSSGSPLISIDSEKILGVVSGTFHQSFLSSTANKKNASGIIQIPRNIGLVRPSNYVFSSVNKLISNKSKVKNKC